MYSRNGNAFGILLLITFPIHAYASEQAIAGAEKEPGIAVALRGGSLGAGLELDYAFNSNWNLRFQVNGFSYDHDLDVESEESGEDIKYNADIDLASYGIIVDWRPFSGSFKLSGGFYANNNEVSAIATSADNAVFAIGEESYIAAGNNPLRLNTNIELGDSSAGYLGLGWGNAYRSGFSFSMDLGVLFAGEPKVELTASGTAALYDNPSVTFDVGDDSVFAAELRQELEAEKRDIQDELSDFEIYPVIMVGVGYRF